MVSLKMHVIVVGAGPSGLILALQLGRAGVRCTLLDAGKAVDERPRAAHYMPCAVREMRRAGVLDDVRAQGLIPGNICWRRLDHSIICEMKDSSQVNNPDALTVLPLGDLGKLLVKHAETYPHLTIHWDHKVEALEQDDQKVTVSGTMSDGTPFQYAGDYACGCDGGQSAVRKLLFGKKFDGHTWPTQIIATNVYYPMETKGLGETNFIMHPEHYFMGAKITNDGMWRVSYGEPADMPFEEVLKRQPWKYKMMLPGKPGPEDYRVASIYPYRIHQRCAEKFRVGRVCLAADAAHLCNPFGGLGLTGGIMDVGGLSQCLIGIYEGKTSPDILDKYDEVRRKIWHDIINPVSSGNFVRVSSDPDKVAETDEIIQMSRKAWEDDEVLKQQHAFAYSICYDFAQHFDKPKEHVQPPKGAATSNHIELVAGTS